MNHLGGHGKLRGGFSPGLSEAAVEEAIRAAIGDSSRDGLGCCTDLGDGVGVL